MAVHWTTRVVTSPHELAACAASLLELYDSCGTPWSPVAHPDWLRAWWRQSSDQWDTSCFLVSADGALVAAVPVQVSPGQRFAGVPVRKMISTSLGWGWSSALVRPQTPASWADLFVQWLDGEAPAWSALEIGAFAPESPVTSQILSSLASNGWFVKDIQREMAVLPLPSTMQEYLSTSRNLRKLYKRVHRRAMESGLRTHYVRRPTADTLRSTVGRVSRVSWQGQAGAAVSVAHPYFYDRLVAAAKDLELELAWVGTPDGECAGYNLAVRTSATHLHSVDTGFDPELAICSPGTLATFVTIEEAIKDGVATADFGDWADYKTAYRPTRVVGRQVVASRGTTAAWVRVSETLRNWREQ